MQKLPAEMFASDTGPAFVNTQVYEWRDGSLLLGDDRLASEAPLAIHINGRTEATVFRTPGHDLELAAGFALGEGFVTDKNQIVDIREMPDENEVWLGIELTASEADDDESSDIGPLKPEVILAIPEHLRQGQTLFQRTGATHGAGLFDAHGNSIVIREDVSRNNAIYKVLGWHLQNSCTPTTRLLLALSGRANAEILETSIVAGLRALVCVSAPTSQAVHLARIQGITLIGFTRQQRFVVYSGHERVMSARAAGQGR